MTRKAKSAAATTHEQLLQQRREQRRESSPDAPKRPWIRLQASIVCPLCNMEEVITTGVNSRTDTWPPSMLDMARLNFNQHLRAKHAQEEDYPQYFIQR